MPKIELKNVYKIFGEEPQSVLPLVQNGATKEEILEETDHTVGLDNVSISVEEGETFVCMGLSGSGKSTLIRHINRLIDPTEGEVLVDGVNVLEFNESELLELRRHEMSMVFQSFGLFPHKTVIQNVAYGLEIQDKPLEERNSTAEEQIKAVGLNGFEHQYPSQLSGGMQRRAELARALINQPLVMIMDEPFRGLDAMTRQLMQEFYLRLCEEEERTNVFVTSELEEAIILADSLVVLSNRPTTVREVVQIDLPRPRNLDMLSSPEAYDYKRHAMEMLHEEALKSFSGTESESEFLKSYTQHA